MAELVSTSTLAVKVVPGASRNRIAGKYGEGIKVQVSAAPERGKANEAVIELLAEFLGISSRQIELISGPTNPRKQFRIQGMGAEELQSRLAALG